MIKLVANPHALLTNNVVTDVVYMQNYNQEEIEETLKKYSYEEVVNCSEYGCELYVGYIKIGSWIVPQAPHVLWVFDDSDGSWNPPVDWNDHRSVEGWFPLCGECSDPENHDHSNDFKVLSSLSEEK